MNTDPFEQNRKTIGGARSAAVELARSRLVLVFMGMMVLYLAVGLRLADLTYLRETADAGAATNAAQDIRPLAKPLRGSIVDRNGSLMAASLKMASVYADATLVDAPPALARQLAAILPEQKYEELLQKLSSGKRFIWLQRNITPKQEYAINALGNPALGFQEEDRRIYPNTGLTAHIIGYTDVDGNGIAGTEKFFNKQLAAAEGPVRLTIDLRVQHVMHRELEKAVKKFSAKGGIGLVMDVATGEIITLVSLPDFDPNRAGAATDQQKFNRATLGVYEMGSTFKLFSTAAALDSGLVHFSSVFDATNPIKIGPFTISDFHAKRRAMTVPEIFIHSSNIGTAKMAASLGPDALRNFYRTMGFMDQTQVELPERATPLYPSPWKEINTLTGSYGHGIAVTPLQLIRAASALVNGGIMPRATLVRPEKARALSLTPEGTRVISAKTSGQMRQLMELVVAAGTGTSAYVEGYNVGGKTGTAEKNLHGGYERNALLSSFLGVFPIQDPRYAVLAILDEPRGTEDTHGFATAGWTAAPVVARVIEQMGPLYRIPPDTEHSREEIKKEMSAYVKELREGNALASIGTDR